jgi:SAM-dependent methyltransferase/methyltransferase-like protein
VEDSQSSVASVEDYFYEALPFVETHPDHLGALAVLFGIRDKPPERFRLLEIGTATGGNILPMAARFPQSRFVGIDRAETSLSVAKARAERAHLSNVVLHLTDLRDFEDEPASFDFIVCHGVYSWIPDDARIALRRLIRRHLAPKGIAYVSFNTLPGWFLRGGLRDMLRREVRGISSQAERIKKARTFLRFLGTNISSEDPARQWLNSELDILGQMSSDYLLGEHLVEHNQAEYFEDFARDMADEGLKFVTDAHVPLVFPERLGSEAAEIVHARSTDMITTQHSLDLLELRCFRRAVLCRDDASLDRRVSASRLEFLAVASRLEPVDETPDLTDGVEVSFKGRSGLVVSDQQLLKAALVVLAAQCPGGMMFDRLAQQVAQQLGRSELDEESRARCRRNLLGLYTKGAIELWQGERPIALGRSGVVRAFSFAREQAREGLPFCTSLLHEAVQTDSFDRAFIKRLDGKSSMFDVVSGVLEDARAGIVSVEMNGGSCLDRAVFDEIAEQKVLLFAQRGLLEG